MIIRLFREPNEIGNNIPISIFNPKTLPKIVTDNIKIDDEQMSKELAENMIFPYLPTDRIPKEAININLDCHLINHLNSKITIKQIFLESEKICNNERISEMANTYARLINQCKVKYQTVFSARIYKLD